MTHRTMKTWREDQHERDHGRFAESPGASGDDAAPRPAEVLADFNREPHTVTTDELDSTNRELEESGADWRVVPTEGDKPGFEALPLDKIEDIYGEHWTVDKDPETDRLVVGDADYFADVEQELVHDPGRWADAFNERDNLSQADVEAANAALEDAGQDARLVPDDEGRWSVQDAVTLAEDYGDDWAIGQTSEGQWVAGSRDWLDEQAKGLERKAQRETRRREVAAYFKRFRYGYKSYDPVTAHAAARRWDTAVEAGEVKPWTPGADTHALPLDVAFLALPDIRQADTFSCGAACAHAVGMFFKVGPETLEEWKECLGTTEERSTLPSSITGFLTALGLTVEARQGMSVAELRQAWLAGRPVICCLQEYADEKTSYEYGHYVCVIGAAHGFIVVQDPSADNIIQGEGSDQAPGHNLIAEEAWLRVWHDHDADGQRYECYGITVGPQGSPPLFGADSGAKAFDASVHPRGQPGNAGQFGSGGGSKKPKKPSAPAKKKPAPQAKVEKKKPVAEGGLKDQASKIVDGKIKETKERAFTGKPTGGKIGKQLAGAIGEEIIIEYLKSKGFEDAQHFSTYLESERNNLPIDLIQDHQLIEAKTGQSSNSPKAQQWRLTFNANPTKEEAETVAKLSKDELREFNKRKQADIHKRKEAALKEVAEELGVPLKIKTMTVILNHDTKTADLYAFDGVHDRLDWNHESTKKAYLGSVKYGAS